MTCISHAVQSAKAEEAAKEEALVAAKQVEVATATTEKAKVTYIAPGSEAVFYDCVVLREGSGQACGRDGCRHVQDGRGAEGCPC